MVEVVWSKPNPVYDVRGKMLELIMLGSHNIGELRAHVEAQEESSESRNGDFVIPIWSRSESSMIKSSLIYPTCLSAFETQLSRDSLDSSCYASFSTIAPHELGCLTFDSLELHIIFLSAWF